MENLSKKSILWLCILALTAPVSLVSCTSSEEDTSILEAELENLDTSEVSLGDEIEDLEDIALEDVEDIGGAGDGFEEDFSEDFSEGSGENFDAALDDELSDDFDEAGGDDDFDDDSEFADFDDADFDEDEAFAAGDDEFDEFDDFGEFDESEKSLAKEMNGQEQVPVAEGAAPAFPEEIIEQPMEVASAQDFMDASSAPASEGVVGEQPPLITSETQDLTIVDPIEPQVPNDDLGIADPIVPEDLNPQEDGPSWVPVVKIKTDPFYRNERLMNAVYIARPGDDMEKISQKLFNEDRSDALNADNPYLAKGIDPGDKIYYNSPNRPNDRTQLKIYYEDIGLPAQNYTTGNDDNMRRLGSKLLGFSEGWKEIWAINANIDSKTILPSKLNLRYWTGNEEVQNLQMAQANESTSNDGMGMDEPPGEPVMGTVDTYNSGDLPPEPPLPDAQIAMPEDTLEPEPIPDIQPLPGDGISDTPSPAPVAQVRRTDDGSLLTVGAGALLLLAAIGLVAIQIKKRKDSSGFSPQSLEYTQV